MDAKPTPHLGAFLGQVVAAYRDKNFEMCAEALVNVVEHARQLERSNAELVEALKDIAENGLRFDLNPTHEFDGTADTAEEFWHHYAKRMDESIRERASTALRNAGVKK